MKKPFTSSTQHILNEAKKRGISIKPIYPGRIAELNYKGHIEFLYHQFISKTSAVACRICREKDATKIFLEKVGISVAKGEAFETDQYPEAEKYLNKIGFPAVLKPITGTHGDLVFSDIRNLTEFKKSWKEISEKCERVIIEKKFVGKEYRIFATRDKTVGIVHRIPANVIGDGKHSLKQLIEIKNEDPKRGENYLSIAKSLIKIRIDDIVKAQLKKKNLTINYVPTKGKQIFLRDNSNISTGGDSIDYTDKVHPTVRQMAPKVIQAIPGLAYGGIDFMSKDITKKLTKDNYIILEINESPGIDLHHLPYAGKSRNAAKEIIDILFPETK